MGIKAEKGSALISVLFVMTVLIMLGTAILNITTTEAMMVSYFKDYTTAYYLAEAGLQKTLAMLKHNPDYTSPHWKAFLGKSHALGDGKYMVTISSTDSNTIKVNSTGNVNKAKSSILSKVKVVVDYIKDEKNSDLEEMIVHIEVQSWAYDGPI